MLKKAIDAKPFYADAFYNLGSVYHLQNEPDKAMHFLRKAFEIDQGHYEALASIGTICKQQGKLVEAKKFLGGTGNKA